MKTFPLFVLLSCATVLWPLAGASSDDQPQPAGSAKWTPEQRRAYRAARGWERMLSTRALPIPGSSIKDNDPDRQKYLQSLPVLPLDSEDPYPTESSAHIKKFLDQRTREQRFFRERPGNVAADGTVKDAGGIKSFVIHPGVQPRPHRAQHYRLNVPNDAKLPSSVGEDNLAERPKHAPPVIHVRGNTFVTYSQTPPGMFPKVDPFLHPPGTNLLPTVYQNMRNRHGHIMPNTLPSHPNNPYNLHDGEPVVTQLPTANSPADDLRIVFEELWEIYTGQAHRRLWEELDRFDIEATIQQVEGRGIDINKSRDRMKMLAQWAIDIIEGNDGGGTMVPSSRAYRGFPLLNHSGHKRNNRVTPVYDENGNIVGANANVHQIWYGGRIQSDTMFFDYGWDDEPDAKQKGVWYSKNGRPLEQRKRPPPIPPDVPWTVTYTIDVLNRGEDDFSPTQIYFDDLEPIDSLADREEVPAYKVFDPKTGQNKLSRFGPPHVAMDQTFFPMQEGTRTVLKVKMAPPKYCNVTYTWGWRLHPPRAQAVENSHKRIPPSGPELVDHYKIVQNHPTWPTLPPFGRLRIVDHERFVFEGLRSVEDEVARYIDDRDPPNSNLTEAALRDKFTKLSNVPFFHPLITDPDHPDFDVEKGPISRIGDLSPAKRMWRMVRGIRKALDDDSKDFGGMFEQLLEARNAFLDWQDRNHLPSGLRPDPNSDFTFVFVNNTIYGESSHGGLSYDEWVLRTDDPADTKRQESDLRLTLVNADYFLHGYINPDFGSSRGWENQFKPTLALGGSGSFFTFGRFHWRFNTEPGVIGIPPAVRVGADGKDIVDPDHPGGILSEDGEPIYDGSLPAGVRPFVHRVWIRYNFEPSRRLRFYQFDPLHHDAAIFSIH